MRGANDWSLLEALPLERIASVQLDDGPIVPIDPDYRTDTVRHRCVPGEGEFDLARFLATVHPPASTLPLSLEVIDDDLLQLQPSVAARRIADADSRPRRLARLRSRPAPGSNHDGSG